MQLPRQARHQIDQAVQAAEQRTAAHFAVVVVAAADRYHDFLLPVGLGLGTLAALAAGLLIRLNWPWLFVIQLALTLAILSIPVLRHGLLRLVPAARLRQRAAQRAQLEYAHMKHHLPPGEAAILVFVARAERYAHLTASRQLREQLGAQRLQHIVDRLTLAVRQHGIGLACATAVDELAALLAPVLPAKPR